MILISKVEIGWKGPKKYFSLLADCQVEKIEKDTSGERKVMMEAMLETRPKSPRLTVSMIIEHDTVIMIVLK